MTAKDQIIIALTLFKGIPDLHSAVPGSGGNTFAIRRPGYCYYVDMRAISIMTEKGTDFFAGADIPDMNGTITVARGDIFAVRRPGDGLHKILIATPVLDGVSCIALPATHGLSPY